MKTIYAKQIKNVACLAALAFANLSTAQAQLASQLGILDLTANGGINPNTGVAWAEGDQYRLTFHTAGGTTATSNDPAFYDDFATAQANLSTLGNGAITTSVGWTALVWVNTDPLQEQGNALSSGSVRAGMTDFTGGSTVGGAGVPIYVMNGTTCIARNHGDITNGWSNPFDSDSQLRLASGSTNNNSAGDPTVAAQNVFYTPYLDQFGLGDTATVHGPNVATGGNFSSHVNALGDVTLAGFEDPTSSRGNSNPNNGGGGGRAWNRFTDSNTSTRSVYVMSPLLTVGTGVPAVPFVLSITPAVDPDTGFDLVWPSKDNKSYRIRSSATLDTAPATWTVVQEDIPSAGETASLNVTPGETKLFYVVEEYDTPVPE